MAPLELMQAMDTQLSHVWLVRTFLKHSPEAEEDEELRDIVRVLYDYSLAVGPAWGAQDAAAYLKMASKKFSKLRAASQTFVEIQPEISSHTNFQMAARSLTAAVTQMEQLLAQARANSAETTAG